MNSHLIIFSIAALAGVTAALVLRHYVYKPNSEKVANPILRALFGLVFHGFNTWILAKAYVLIVPEVSTLLSFRNTLADTPADVPLSLISYAGLANFIEGFGLASFVIAMLYLMGVMYHSATKLFWIIVDLMKKGFKAQKIPTSSRLKKAKAR